MSDLRLSGLASGLDTTALIEKLMQVERRPIIMSQSRITKNNLVLESLRGLSTKFIALEEAAKKVQNLASFSPSASTDNTSTPFKEKVVDIGSSSVLGAGLLQTLNAKTFGTEAGAVGGEYTVKVNSRAQTNTITTGPVPLQTDGFVADRGYLKFTNLSDGTVINLGADPAVSWGDNKSLKEVADWINAQGSAPMTASVANNRLILTAKNTGAAFNYSVEVAAQAGAGVAADSYNMGFRAATSAGTSSSSEKVVDVSSAAVLGVGISQNAADTGGPSQVEVLSVARKWSFTTGIVEFDENTGFLAGDKLTFEIHNTGDTSSPQAVYTPTSGSGGWTNTSMTPVNVAAWLESTYTNNSTSPVTAKLIGNRITFEAKEAGAAFNYRVEALNNAVPKNDARGWLGLDSASTDLTTGTDASIRVTDVNGNVSSYQFLSDSSSGSTTSSFNTFGTSKTGLAGVTLFALSPGSASFNIRTRTSATTDSSDTDLTTVTQGRDASITVTRPDNTSQTYTNTSSTAGTGTSSSNRFTAATTGLTGVTLFSLAEGESSFNIRERETSSGAVSNTAVQEASTSIGAIRDMITKYNELISQLKTDTAYDVNTQKGGPLSNDASIAALSAQLSTIFSAPFTEIPIATGYTYPTPDTGLTVAKPVGSALGAGEFAAHDNEGYRNYQDVGFRVERDGKITIDEVKLKAALTAKPDAVRRLFAYEDGATQAGNSAVLLNRGGTSTTWGDGIATRLRNFANQQSSSVSAFNGIGSNGQRLEGAVLSRISSIGRQNSLLNDGIKRNETRLVARERMLRIQFQAMEKAVSSLKTQGNYLQSQFNKQSG